VYGNKYGDELCGVRLMSQTSVQMIMPRERNSGGQFTSDVTDDNILAFFQQGERPFHTASEVADEFELDRSTAYRRLDDLHEQGRLEKTDVGARAVVWWQPQE
jgi:response regulator of citrate/malate metabolism